MRKLKGTVVSNKMQATVVVRVDRLRKHPKYLKYYQVSRTYKAHDGKKKYQTGDEVIIAETRPLSREKRWIVVELVKRPTVMEEAEEDQHPKNKDHNDHVKV